jgi:uncharacterized membrane protein HdeD (DUF308 family)
MKQNSNKKDWSLILQIIISFIYLFIFIYLLLLLLLLCVMVVVVTWVYKLLFFFASQSTFYLKC